ncbi:hypothetical protein AB0D49_20400 [Streptomyces sp. NPDC048290]|uniref:hypothetical protein n=1 Tax=Streptomyces sp. NPDC048290 TaxID=3155811 RepID=UPI003416D566
MPTPPQTTDELYQALQDNDRRPYGRSRTVTAEELAEAAEQFAEPAVLVDALLELQEAYTYGSEPRKSPVVFARLLTLYDEQPDVFDDRTRHLLFWRFKWVAHALRQLPEIPLTTLRQWLTEMRERYQRAGLGLQPYYGQAYQLAQHVGGDTTAAYELWAARTRDRLSDCEACETCGRAQYRLAQGDDKGALRMWEPVLAGQESCQEEPARSISHALLPLLRTGRSDRARELHLAGYRGCRRSSAMSAEIGRHLEFCALTGNEARGLELLAENRTLFDETDSPLDQLDFLTGTEVLLQRVEALGHGELPAAGPAGRTWTAAALRAELHTRADDLAARFDARNGTTTHTDRRRTRLDRAPLLDGLELTLRPRTLDDITPAAAPTAAPRADAPTEPLPDLILRARKLEAEGHPDALACWRRLRALATARGYTHPADPAVGPLVRLRADLLSDEAARAVDRHAYPDAAELHEEAAALYEDAGAPGHAVLARACALFAAAADDEGDGEAGEATDRAARLTDAHMSLVRLHEAATGLAPYQEARLLRLRATLLGLRLQTTGDQDHAEPLTAEVERLHTFATRHGVVSQISAAELQRATVHALTGELPAAIAALDAQLDRLRAHGPAWHLPRALGLRGRLHLGDGDAAAAHTDLTEALRLAADWPAGTVDTARLHGDTAQAALHLGRPEEALRHLTRSAELDLRQGSRTEAYCTYSNAAQLSLDLGRVEDCIALLDSLLSELDAVAGELDDRLLAQLRLTRARALHSGEDRKAATAEFVALAAESAAWDDDPGSHAMIAAETAVVLAENGDFARARDAARQALAAHARSPRYEQLSNSLRELARLQAEQQGAEGLTAALAHLADAARVADEAQAAGYTARGRALAPALAYEHGRVNAYAGAYEDSLAALEQALALLGDRGPEDDPEEWSESVRLAAVVEGLYLERTAAALTRLDSAISRLTDLDRTAEQEPLRALAARLRDEE